jgi:predicted acyltransferase
MKSQFNRKERLLSLDALRGFDMLFIMGLSGWIVSLCGLFPSSGLMAWLSSQMEHVEWNGLTHHDTIFPLFLFIAGISFPFSIAKQRENGKTERQILVKVIKRGVILVFLGMVYNGLFQLNFADLRCASVLGRIGLAWMFSALLFMKLRPKTLGIVAAVLLVGYWLLLWLVPGGADTYSFGHNFAGTVDRVLLPGRLIYGNNHFDPEGLLSTLPAVVTAMLGMFTGQFIRLSDDKVSGNKKVLYMLAAAVVLLIVGWAWSYVFPVNKKLWSSSFVCVVAAYSLFLFAAFYYIIDVKGYRKWTLFFRVVGMNSITIYLAQSIINFSQASKFFFGGLAGKFPEVWANLINATGYIIVCWLFLWFLYRKNVFLKV